MKNSLAAACALVACLAFTAAASARTWTEPKSGTAFEVKRDGITLWAPGCV